eukprot:TRINITY_DN213_c0_g2_i1.p1 TRINITY_DN213_c0_g2~~TRINITY_DN213_c0_g2_i1.p1  ORF type:complete len:489 (+),score=117.27 TRINITY_DN213_c0_g2_i1:62-1528(+)
MFQQPGSFVVTPGYGQQPSPFGGFQQPNPYGYGQPQPQPQPNPWGNQIPQMLPQPQQQFPQFQQQPQAQKWVDPEFPPNNNSIYASPNPAADHVQDIVNQLGQQVRWARVTDIADVNGQRPQKLFNNIHPNDIMQGILGDCWLLAGFSTLAEFPQMIDGLFQEKDLSPNGQYHVRLYDARARQWQWVVIDDYIPIGPDGQPAFSKPRESEAWVLLLEKACAKWFGSYVQLAGAFAMAPFMFLTDSPNIRAFSQPVFNGQYDPSRFDVKQYSMADPHNRNSVRGQPLGLCPSDQAFEELKMSDDQGWLAAAWTSKDPPVQAGVGASGEAIAADGIVKGHAYSLVSADRYQADGRIWRIVQIRNPWGSNPNAEWKGELSDAWPQWSQFPELRRKLGIDCAEMDGLFFMPWERFIERFSDWGYAQLSGLAPRYAAAETARARGMAPPPVMRSLGLAVQDPAAVKKFRKATAAGASATQKKVVTKKKNRGCC